MNTNTIRIVKIDRIRILFDFSKMTEYEYYSHFQKLPNTNTNMNGNTNTNKNTNTNTNIDTNTNTNTNKNTNANKNTKKNTNTNKNKNLGHIWNQTEKTNLINVPSVIMPPLIQPV